MKELVWREFAYHLIYHFPHTVNDPLRVQFAQFPWRLSEEDLAHWKRGETGYPLVDAGMRQLWRTGWMHNRVRMVVGSFLVKHLLLPWQSGAAWFMDTLLDADLASNTLGWQWVAGCGADAAPYFRVFNPVMQGEKFDPEGDYIRRWVPELGALPKKWIHKPWESPVSELSKAGIVLGRNYPAPLVDHSEARTRALRAYDEIKK
jgi:deoxyribodipyrimidine photo-lyase